MTKIFKLFFLLLKEGVNFFFKNDKRGEIIKGGKKIDEFIKRRLLLIFQREKNISKVI